MANRLVMHAQYGDRGSSGRSEYRGASRPHSNYTVVLYNALALDIGTYFLAKLGVRIADRYFGNVG